MTEPRAALPTNVRDHVREFLAGGRAPAPVRDAATVALVRDGAEGLEVYLLRRVRAMSFAAGMYVFPGGSVDADDALDGVGWSGPEPDFWGRAFGTDAAGGRALVSAAVRETFEECGVLLAGPSPDTVVDGLGTEEWEAERAALEARAEPLAALLERHGLLLRADLLAPLAHWVTPQPEPKRFDTRFFLAALPPGQECREVGGEADTRVWTRPADAISSGFGLMPPTLAALRQLAEYPDVAAALAHRREIVRVMPAFTLVDGEVRLVMPGDPGYAEGAG